MESLLRITAVSIISVMRRTLLSHIVLFQNGSSTNSIIANIVKHTINYAPTEGGVTNPASEEEVTLVA